MTTTVLFNLTDLFFIYRDIGLILSEEDRVPCVFRSDAEGLGHLDTSTQTSEGNDLQEGTRIELPLWIAEKLTLKKMVKVEDPKHYGKRYLKFRPIF